MKIYMVIQLWFIHNLFCYLIICEMNVIIYVCLNINLTILATNQYFIYLEIKWKISILFENYLFVL
jgi:hypothetical protein